MLKMFYIFCKWVVESVITSAASVLCSALESLELIFPKRLDLLENLEHPLQNTVTEQQSVFSQGFFRSAVTTFND